MGMCSRGLLEVERGMERFLLDSGRICDREKLSDYSRRSIPYGIEPL